MKTKTVTYFVRTIGILLLAGYSISASADFVQTMGMSNREGALAGATQGVAADASTWYVNPAGAAEFKKPVLSLGFRFVDTTQLNMHDSGGTYKVEATTVNGEIAAAPGLGVYLPLSDKITAGVGLGVPFALTADWENDAGVHRYSFSNQAFFTVDIGAVVGMEVTERLNVGVALNLVAFKHLTVERLVPVTVALGGNAGPDALVVGRVLLETEMDFPLFVPPFQFDPAFDEIGFTIGAKYEMADNLRFGVSYRSEQDTKFDGDATVDFNNPLGLGKSIVPWKLDFDTPAHIKAGFAHDLNDMLTWSVDLQYTFWSDADAVGKPANIKFGDPLSGFAGPAGILNGVSGVSYDWEGDDTLAVAAGVQMRMNDKLTLLGGYRYDPETADDHAIDVLFWSGDRHWIGVGATYDLTNADGRGWALTAGWQGVFYQDRRIEAGESRNLGGFSHPALYDPVNAPGVLTNATNDEWFKFSGWINLFGFDVTYSF